MPFLTAMPSLFCLLVLSGEEVPDLLQKLASEHPDTDPMIKAVSKYHRQEEARHLAFGRMLFPEQWAAAGPIERFLVRHLGSRIAIAMFDTIVHPGVYATVGLPDLADLAGRQPLAPAARPCATGPCARCSPRCSRRASSAAAGSPGVGRSPAASTAPVATSTRSRRPDPVPPDLRRPRATARARLSSTPPSSASPARATAAPRSPTSAATRGSPRRRRTPTSPTRRRSSSPRSTRTSPG